MPYVIGAECIDEPLPQDRRVNAQRRAHLADSRRSFLEELPGRDASLGDPRGAAAVGGTGPDTALVAGGG